MLSLSTMASPPVPVSVELVPPPMMKSREVLLAALLFLFFRCLRVVGEAEVGLEVGFGVNVVGVKVTVGDCVGFGVSPLE